MVGTSPPCSTEPVPAPLACKGSCCLQSCLSSSSRTFQPMARHREASPCGNGDCAVTVSPCPCRNEIGGEPQRGCQRVRSAVMEFPHLPFCLHLWDMQGCCRLHPVLALKLLPRGAARSISPSFPLCRLAKSPGIAWREMTISRKPLLPATGAFPVGASRALKKKQFPKCRIQTKHPRIPNFR